MVSGKTVLETGSQTVTLVQDSARPGAYLVRIGGTDQSYVDLADPLRLEFDYVPADRRCDRRGRAGR